MVILILIVAPPLGREGWIYIDGWMNLDPVCTVSGFVVAHSFFVPLLSLTTYLEE